MKLTLNYLMKEYVDKGKSTSEIAKSLKCHPEKVRRALKKHGIPVRNKAQAAQNFYEQGGVNARKGYTFTDEEKEANALRAKEFYLHDERANEVKEKLSKLAKKQWDKISDKERKKIAKRLHQASHEASKHGSKAELKLAELLHDKYDWMTMQKVKQIPGIGDLECDIVLPEKKVVIEVDGVVHRDAIFDEKRLKDAKDRDKKKNDILTAFGWKVIRIKVLCEKYSLGSCLMTAEKIDNLLNSKKLEQGKVFHMEME
jgi:very-short-patch-repair endonuclease